MKYLISGGSGFLGDELARELKKQGAWLRNLDLMSSSSVQIFDNEFVGDLRDLGDCILATKGIDVVFHTAAAVPLIKNNKVFKDTNILGTDNLLRASLLNGVKKFVFVSSSAVFGFPTSNPVTDISSRTPFEAYGKSKLSAEEICKNYINQNMIIHIVRPRTILGPNRLGLFSVIFRLIEENAAVPIFNKGRLIYDFIHVEDLCRALIRVSQLEGNLILNLGSREKFTLLEVLEILITSTESKSSLVNFPTWPTKLLLSIAARIKLVPFAPYQIKLYGEEFYFDDKASWRLLHLTPKFSSAEAILAAYESYRLEITSLNSVSVHKSRRISGALKIDLMVWCLIRLNFIYAKNK